MQKAGRREVQNLFERSNQLNEPVEAFFFDAAKETFPVTAHWHYFAELIYMRSGIAEMTANGCSVTLSAGDLMIFPPSSVHSIAAPEGVLPVYDGLKFDVAKFPSISPYSPSPSSMFRCAAENGMPLSFCGEEAERMECSEIFADCISEAKNRRYGYDLMLRAQIYRLIYRIIRAWIEKGLDPEACTDPPEKTSAIDRITELIDSRLFEPLRVQELAAECHLSYSAFAVQFRERYGMTCKEYIERMRMLKAEEYLRFTDLDISEISRETGFSDSSHFIRSFKQKNGITPKQYRMMYRRRV